MSGKEYEVEDVIGIRKKSNRIELLIKWAGYGIEESTWEGLATCNCPLLLKPYQVAIKKLLGRLNIMKEIEPVKAVEKDIWKVDNILGVRLNVEENPMRIEYLIKWLGYPSNCNSWEPEANVFGKVYTVRFAPVVDHLRSKYLTKSNPIRISKKEDTKSHTAGNKKTFTPVSKPTTKTDKDQITRSLPKSRVNTQKANLPMLRRSSRTASSPVSTLMRPNVSEKQKLKAKSNSGPPKRYSTASKSSLHKGETPQAPKLGKLNRPVQVSKSAKHSTAVQQERRVTRSRNLM